MARGWHKVEHALRDEDLDPLHDEPRWQEAIDDMKREASEEE